MIDIIEKKIEHFVGIENKKTQIILTHTSRNVKEYLTSLKYRHNKKYNKVPHFIITREGRILQTLDTEKYSKFLNDIKYDRQSIIICLENLGWLEKEPLKNYHINWIGSIYKEKVLDKKWRDYFFWEPYTKIQLEKTAELCKKLSNEYSINLTCIGHNTKTSRMETFNGILTRSNIDDDSTDVSPAFDFEYFIKQLENE
jgi:N-acetyl-anhydromuramyl-L-alanine amidase AmpD